MCNKILLQQIITTKELKSYNEFSNSIETFKMEYEKNPEFLEMLDKNNPLKEKFLEGVEKSETLYVQVEGYVPNAYQKSEIFLKKEYIQNWYA